MNRNASPGGQVSGFDISTFLMRGLLNQSSNPLRLIATLMDQ
jgi:hypothetical protein